MRYAAIVSYLLLLSTLPRVVAAQGIHSAVTLAQPADDLESPTAVQGVVRKSPLVAGVLSAFIPGAGQFYNGQAGKGAVMLLLGGGAVGVAVAGGRSEKCQLESSCAALWAGLAGATVIWIWSVVDAISSANSISGRSVSASPTGSAPFVAVERMERETRVLVGLRIAL
jgi:hypothetical protein